VNYLKVEFPEKIIHDVGRALTLSFRAEGEKSLNNPGSDRQWVYIMGRFVIMALAALGNR
jgi:hypothetical protein